MREARRGAAAFSLAVALVALTAACGGGGGGSPPPPPPPITVTISPTSQNVFLGATQQFTASVSGTTNTAVTWSVNGITGGNSTVGTIDVNGLYRAPAILPSPVTVSIRASSQANGTSSASATVTVTSDVVVSITAPAQSASVELGAQQQAIAGIASTGNGASQSVTWSLSGNGCTGSACGTISTGGMFTAPGILPSTPNRDVTVTATSVADPAKTATLTLHIVANFTFAINSPTGNTINNALTFQFVAIFTPVPGSNPNTSVTWSVSGSGCLGTACGTIDQAGLYTAPNIAPSPPQVTISAISVADSSKGQTTPQITINTIILVAILPASLGIEIEAQQTFTANVGGTANRNVTWDISGPGCTNPGNPCGSLSVGTGQVVVDTFAVTYTAPITIPSGGIGPVTITVTSVADPTKSASTTPTFFSTIQPNLLPSGSTRAVNHRQTMNAVLVRTSTGTAPVNNAVEWRVNGVLGGNTTVGLICQQAADGTPCSQVSVTPSGPPSTPFQVDFLAPGSTAVGAATIEMRSQADTSKFITAVVTVVANVAVNVSPSTSTLPPSGMQQFTASVAGAFNQAVTWNVAAAAGGQCNEVSLVPSVAGKISCGTIDAAGNYTAPNAAPAASSPGNQVTVTATSVDSPGQSGSGTVTIAAGAFISKISPASITALSSVSSTPFTLQVIGNSFAPSSPGPGATIVFNAVTFDGLSGRSSTTCSSTTCSAQVPVSAVAVPGILGVQVQNPQGSAQPGSSNLVLFVVLDPATEQKDFASAGVVPLNQPCTTPGDGGCQNITVVEPTTMGSTGAVGQVNLTSIGVFSGSSCLASSSPITIVRPTNITSSLSICVVGTSNFMATDKFTISGPTSVDITVAVDTNQSFPSFSVKLILSLPFNAKTGPRTLFVETSNREKSALVGAIEVK